ncbi:MAG: hypothetical protein Q9195_008979 [Heterodermia aff. obscurata]
MSLKRFLAASRIQTGKIRERMKIIFRDFLMKDRAKFTIKTKEFHSNAAREYLLSDYTHFLNEKAYEDSVEDSVPDRSGPTLSDLPADIILRISGFVDIVTLLSFHYTNRTLRENVSLKDAGISRCARWMMLHLLEKDSADKGDSPPDRLACWYCKTSHPKEDFGVEPGNVGFGIERLSILTVPGRKFRFCWRYIPKFLDYTPSTDDLKTDFNDDNQVERWIEVPRHQCMHCSSKTYVDQTGRRQCSECKQECEICGFREVSIFERRGPKRPFESFENLRFVQRMKHGYQTEIRDMNGLRRPGQQLHPEPRIWKNKSSFNEFLQHSRAEDSILPRKRQGDQQRRFALYVPLEFLPKRLWRTETEEDRSSSPDQ